MSELISVVLPAYNAEKFISEAIYSILHQTHRNLELIIINDGSTDATEEKILTFTDKRIRYLKKNNSGIVDSLNIGIELSKGDVIARMDADDVSHTTRLAEQLVYLRENNLAICGTSLRLIDKRGVARGLRIYPESDREIRFLMKFSSPFAHPTVMVRKELFQEFKYQSCLDAEDYDLWVRVAMRENYIFGNLKKPLLDYRIHGGQVSIKSNNRQRNETMRIGSLYRTFLGEKELESMIQKFSANSEKNVMDLILRKILSDAKKIVISSENILMVFKQVIGLAGTWSWSLHFRYAILASRCKPNLLSELRFLASKVVGKKLK